MDNQKEMVLVEKVVMDELVSTINRMQKQLDDILQYVYDIGQMVGATAEKLGIA